MKAAKAIAVSLSVLVTFAVIVAVSLLQLFFGIFTPIRFYGRITDTDGNPVPAAQIYVSLATFPYSKGIRDDTTSDSNGNFSIWGHGAGIVIMVSRDGYYTLDQSRGSFQTWPPGTKQTWPDGAGDYPSSSSTNPIVFKLRKRGVCEPLVVNGGKFGLTIQIRGDGTPVSMDLTAGRAYRLTKEDIKFQAWIDDQDRKPGTYSHFDWRFKISVPGGGLQQRRGEFDFRAPQDGYAPTDEIVVLGSDPKWSSSATRDYFLKLDSGQYARIKIEIGVGGYNDFNIISYLNPVPGHSNLEYDPNLSVSK